MRRLQSVKNCKIAVSSVLQSKVVEVRLHWILHLQKVHGLLEPVEEKPGDLLIIYKTGANCHNCNIRHDDRINALIDQSI